MIITPLGHTEFLVDIANREGENIRILVDSWLSDYAIGDLMERSVKVVLDPEKIQTIDAIYISHAHTDHLDPYTLVSIYHQNLGISMDGNLRQELPLLILPISLRYLAPLFAQYLPNACIHWLGNREVFMIRGIEITGYMFPQSEITNEDDVMIIGISSETELLFAEIDTVPDEYDASVQESLFRIFTHRDYETACYLASRNELEGQLRIYDLPTGKQSNFRDQYRSERKESIRESYAKYEYEEFVDFPNLFTLPGFVRGYIGQGICYPEALSPELALLSIFPLDAIASLESDIAKNHGYTFPQKALLPGRQYKIEKGSIETGRKECPIGILGENKKQIATANLPPASQGQRPGRVYASGPLFPRDQTPESIEGAKKQILEVLNHRFLPYWSASPVASLRDALLKHRDGCYRISFAVSSAAADDEDTIVFEYSFASTGFREVAYAEDMRIDEDYWLDDVLDLLDGQQDLYSNFWHSLDPTRVYRLWTCLGANFCNNDLVLKKYRLHFERAIRGETAEDWVRGVIETL